MADPAGHFCGSERGSYELRGAVTRRGASPVSNQPRGGADVRDGDAAEGSCVIIFVSPRHHRTDTQAPISRSAGAKAFERLCLRHPHTAVSFAVADGNPDRPLA